LAFSSTRDRARRFGFRQAGDRLVLADFDGDGRDEPGSSAQGRRGTPVFGGPAAHRVAQQPRVAAPTATPTFGLPGHRPASGMSPVVPYRKTLHAYQGVEPRQGVSSAARQVVTTRRRAP
jgi:hypothetical protein